MVQTRKKRRHGVEATRRAATSAAKTREAIAAAAEAATITANARAEAEEQLKKAIEATDAANAAAATALADCKTAIAEIKRLKGLDARTATKQSEVGAAIIQRAIRAMEMAQRYANRARGAARIARASADSAVKHVPSRFSRAIAALFEKVGVGIQSVESLRREATENALAAGKAAKMAELAAADARKSAESTKVAGLEARKIFDNAMSSLIQSWEHVALQAEKAARRAATPEEALAATAEAELALRAAEALVAAKL